MTQHDTSIARQSAAAPHIAALAEIAGPGIGLALSDALTEFMRQAGRANAWWTRDDRHVAATDHLMDGARAAYDALLED